MSHHRDRRRSGEVPVDLDVLGADAAIDYKSENVGERLSALCPDGISVDFDNVGGEVLQAGIGRMKVHGRIAIWGMISGYNDETPSPGPKNPSISSRGGCGWKGS